MTEILVVDDSELDHAYVKRMFRGLQRIREWNAEYVSSGEQALIRLQERRFDLVLTDYYMPNMNGLELLQQVQQLGIDTPVIIMTANGSEELVLDSLRGGAANYVMKRKLDRELPVMIEKMNWSIPVEGTSRSQRAIAEPTWGVG
ncbi:response regulator [Schlesneria paludicola]|uniref:response regulator n=1 Tax=Schlesneria paludicola TaxID=360056 RepID=UPI00029A9237|nr:response regulator [Schlesneria paludicola]